MTNFSHTIFKQINDNYTNEFDQCQLLFLNINNCLEIKYF